MISNILKNIAGHLCEEEKCLANDIFNEYHSKVFLESCIVGDIAEKMCGCEELDTLKAEMIKRCKLEKNEDKAALEALELAGATSMSVSTETMMLCNDDDKYADESSLYYYCDSNKVVDKLPKWVFSLVAAECLLNSHLFNVPCKDYLQNRYSDLTLSDDLVKKFDMAFDNRENIIKDSKTGLQIVAYEEFFSRSVYVRQLIRSLKKVSVADFKRIALEGDAITVSRTDKGGWKSYANRFPQGQSFTSLKMIGPGCNTVIGFGVRLADEGGNVIREIPYEEFAKTCTAMVICRPKKITPSQRHQAYLFMQRYMNNNQQYMTVGQNLMSVIRHMLQYGHSDDKKEMTKEEIEQFKGRLLCSSVVANAYRHAGVDNGFHSVKEYDVWPKDFLTSPAYEHPCGWFAPGELPEEYFVNDPTIAEEAWFSATRGFVAKDMTVANKVDESKKVTPTDFKRQVKDGDVLIVYRKPQYLLSGGVTLNTINRWITKTSFMSIKIVTGGGKTATGFGAHIGSVGIKEVPMDYLIETCSGMICIRHYKITDSYRRKIVEHVNKLKRIDPKYDFLAIVKEPWTHRKEERSGAEKILTKDEAKTYFKPMICTTLITASYRAAGLDPEVPFSDKNAWPIDVLRSPAFKPICSYFDKDQGM